MIIASRKRDFHGRTNTEEEVLDDQEDRFSNLPELLIVKILSLLDFKEAVKTGVLAKSWINLWTRVYNLVLRRDGTDHITIGTLSIYEYWELIRDTVDKRWISSVDATLDRCTTTDIDRFCLIFESKRDLYHERSPIIIHKWIPYALDRNVKILQLSNFSELPERLFQNSSVTTLELFHCHLAYMNMPSSVNLSSLESLRLEHPNLGEDFLEKLIMGCPVLQTLVLVDISFIYHINIMSPSVIRFTLDGVDNYSDSDFFEIKAPWLQELEISKTFVTGKCELVDVSSLKKATLTLCTMSPMVHISVSGEEDWNNSEEVMQYNYRWIPMVTQLLYSLSFVGELTIGSQPLQVLTISKMLGKPSPLFKCKHLSIETPLWKFDLPGIVCLLENAPHLETLFIKVVNDYQYVNPLDQTEKLFKDENPYQYIVKGKFLHLKKIVIDFWRYPCYEYDYTENLQYFDYELVDYMLRSAVVLEKLVLCSSSRSCRHNCAQPNCAFQYVPRLAGNLIAISLCGNEVATEWDLKRCKNKFVFTFSN